MSKSLTILLTPIAAIAPAGNHPTFSINLKSVAEAVKALSHSVRGEKEGADVNFENLDSRASVIPAELASNSYNKLSRE